MTTRREFLQQSAAASLAVSFGAGLPSLFARAAARAEEAGGENVLVVVQLSGGNDGLNTVVPFKDPAYRKYRPKLAIPAADLAKINDDLGLHPSARGLADLLEANRMAIVQGVGYPNPNRSHFESMDIWHTCRRKEEPRPDGWLGRYLDAAASGNPDVPAMHLGETKQPFALISRDIRVPSVKSLDRFRLDDAGNKSLVEAVRELTAGEPAASNDLLGFVQTSAEQALDASRLVEQARGSGKSSATYPDNGLANKLRTVAQLIDAGLKTRVFYVELDGFDTHSQQPDAHAALLSQFAGSLRAFLDDLHAAGHLGRTMVMAFSEFGRRVAENASDGTDHGAAGPMFLAGGKVKAGVIGKHPSLTDLVDGDLRHHTDFRQVYAAVLQDWLGVPSAPILGGNFTPVAICDA